MVVALSDACAPCSARAVAVALVAGCGGGAGGRPGHHRGGDRRRRSRGDRLLLRRLGRAGPGRRRSGPSRATPLDAAMAGLAPGPSSAGLLPGLPARHHGPLDPGEGDVAVGRLQRRARDRVPAGRVGGRDRGRSRRSCGRPPRPPGTARARILVEGRAPPPPGPSSTCRRPSSPAELAPRAAMTAEGAVRVARRCPPRPNSPCPCPRPQPGAERGDSAARPPVRAARRAAAGRWRSGTSRPSCCACAAAPSACSAGWWPRSSRATRGWPGSAATWWASRRRTGRDADLTDGRLLRRRPRDHRRLARPLQGHRDRRGARARRCGWTSASARWWTRAGRSRPSSPTLTGIDDAHGRGAARTSSRRSSGFVDFAGQDVLVAHNAPFDLRFLNYERRRLAGRYFTQPWLDTLVLARAPARTAGWSATTSARSPTGPTPTCAPCHRALPGRRGHGRAAGARCSGCSPSAAIDTLERAVAFGRSRAARATRYKLALAEDLPDRPGRLPDARPRGRRALRGQGGQPAPPGALLLRPGRPPRAAHRAGARASSTRIDHETCGSEFEALLRENAPHQGPAPAVQPAGRRAGRGATSSSALGRAVPRLYAVPRPARRRGRLLRARCARSACARARRSTALPLRASTAMRRRDADAAARRRRRGAAGPCSAATRGRRCGDARPCGWRRREAPARLGAAAAAATERRLTARPLLGDARPGSSPRGARAPGTAAAPCWSSRRGGGRAAPRPSSSRAAGWSRHRPRSTPEAWRSRAAAGLASPAGGVRRGRPSRRAGRRSTRWRSWRTACASAPGTRGAALELGPGWRDLTAPGGRRPGRRARWPRARRGPRTTRRP